ncbi:class I SAM-dependent methyltransferase [Tsukamurella sp. 8F]|uniref:class I SAM-dependent methyltransferase n=1 Tax=unclassified Tsukamurella TaxID=2633480 RepID=UPI0023B9D9A9|nr:MULTISPECIES: class I SAM-dependent methyltransferase [unclassified Tsukamurella]MDF0531409.1 class I SAM-dependent methyltransferase [Tsukamurella sp. 8J]MDF0585285.1 class I SAM-dependent methyltransferase [Tsukamurella sp. 8F]
MTGEAAREAGPEDTSARTALWRALHTELDAPPVLEDTVGLELLAPEDGWRARGDMDPAFTRGMRAWIATRSRFVEDLVVDSGVEQYVLLGAGVDTFVQRRPRVRVRVFEIDRPEPQEWKRGRLAELALPAPTFVPVDFESDGDWPAGLRAAGFDPARPAVVASLGVSMYLTREATMDSLARVARFARGTEFAMTFQPPTESLVGAARELREIAMAGAARNGTPFISFYTPEDAIALARDAGFAEARCVSTEELTERYFAGRADGLVPSHGEEFLVARVGD